MAIYGPEEFTRDRLAQGATESDIRRELQETYNFPPDTCRRLVADAKVRNPEALERRQQHTQRVRQEQKKSSPLTIASGVGLVVIGVMVLAAIWGQMSADGGKPGFIPMMAGLSIFSGVGMLVKGCWHLIRRG